MSESEGLKTERKYLDYYFETENLTERIFRILTMGRFSRSKPTLPIETKEIIREEFVDSALALVKWAPFYLVGLWGGSKENDANTADQADITALDNLCALRDEVSSVHRYKPRLELVLLFCDLHHIVANNRALHETKIYFNSLKKLTDERKIQLVSLHDDLYKMHQIHHFINPLDYISNIDARKKTIQVISNKDVFGELISAAKKHSRWIEQGISPEKIAKLYVEMELHFFNSIERTGIRLKESTNYLSGADIIMHKPIFFSFSDPKIQKPIAEAAGVPMLYFHSKCPKHGFNECPWYVDSTKEHAITDK